MMRGVLVAAAALGACATAPKAPPVHIGPSMTQQQCNLIKLAGQKFDVDMRGVELEKALRGLADCTCFHFELQAGTTASITLPPQPKALDADALFAEFVKAADA